jgi:hypothetical protein
MRAQARVILLKVSFYLIAQKSDDTNQLDLFRIGQRGEGVEHMPQYSFSSHTNQLLGLAPGMWPQTRA